MLRSVVLRSLHHNRGYSAIKASSAIDGHRIGKSLIKNRLAEPQETRIIRRNLGGQSRNKAIGTRLQLLKRPQHHGRKECLLECRILNERQL